MSPPFGPSGARPKPDVASGDLLFYIDMALVGIFGVVILIYLPATIIRYSHPSVWKEGWLLRKNRPGCDSAASPQNPTAYVTEMATVQSRQHLFSVAHDPLAPPFARPRLLGCPALNSSLHTPPIHLRSYTSYLPTLSRILEYHLLGVTVQQLVALVVYIILTAVGLFYQYNQGEHTKRAGWVVMSQMPLVFALGTKNSVVTALTGISYEKLNFLHRWVGRIMFIAALLHIVYWGTSHVRNKPPSWTIQHNAWGLVAFISLCICALGSIYWIRAEFHPLFYNSHIVGLLGMIIGVWKHQPRVATPYVASCIALYGADILLRLAKTRFRKATLDPLPELRATQLHIPDLDTGWVAGQHVRIRVLSLGVGLIGWTESHPFTIANAGSDSPQGLTLVCKSVGDWTSRLYKMASDGSIGGRRCSAYVAVEGPYGGPKNIVINSFSGVMLVLGGCGISFGTSVLQDIVAKSFSGDSRVLSLNFVWVVQRPAAAAPCLGTFIQLVRRANLAPDPRITISIFYTERQSESIVLPPELPSNILFWPGRPDLRKELNQTISSTSRSINGAGSPRNGVILAGCGPESLMMSVFRAKSEISHESQRAVGGLELYTEYFSR